LSLLGPRIDGLFLPPAISATAVGFWFVARPHRLLAESTQARKNSVPRPHRKTAPVSFLELVRGQQLLHRFSVFVHRRKGKLNLVRANAEDMLAHRRWLLCGANRAIRQVRPRRCAFSPVVLPVPQSNQATHCYLELLFRRLGATSVCERDLFWNASTN